MSNEFNTEPTPSEKVAMHLFGILYSVLQSPNTALHTKSAILQTMQQVLNDDNGPFQQDDNMNELGAVFAKVINEIVPQMKGEQMLQNIFSTENQYN